MVRIFGELPDDLRAAIAAGQSEKQVMAAYEKFLPWLGNDGYGKKVVEDRESDREPISRTGTSLISRDLIIFGRTTTACREDEMWAALNDVAEREG